MEWPVSSTKILSGISVHPSKLAIKQHSINQSNYFFSADQKPAEDDTMTEDEGQDWLYDLLTEVQLNQFYTKLRDDLQVTRSVSQPLNDLIFF